MKNFSVVFDVVLHITSIRLIVQSVDPIINMSLLYILHLKHNHKILITTINSPAAFLQNKAFKVFIHTYASRRNICHLQNS